MGVTLILNRLQNFVTKLTQLIGQKLCNLTGVSWYFQQDVWGLNPPSPNYRIINNNNNNNKSIV